MRAVSACTRNWTRTQQVHSTALRPANHKLVQKLRCSCTVQHIRNSVRLLAASRGQRNTPQKHAVAVATYFHATEHKIHCTFKIFRMLVCVRDLSVRSTTILVLLCGPLRLWQCPQQASGRKRSGYNISAFHGAHRCWVDPSAA